MKDKLNKILTVAVIFLLACILWIGANNFVSAKDEIKWEYYSYEASTSGPTDQILNKLGGEGWELVAIETRTVDSNTLQSPRYVFKRPKR